MEASTDDPSQFAPCCRSKCVFVVDTNIKISVKNSLRKSLNESQESRPAHAPQFPTMSKRRMRAALLDGARTFSRIIGNSLCNHRLCNICLYLEKL